MIELYIHPGYGKTATTFLQRNIFSSLINVTQLGKPIDRKNKLIELQNQLFKPNYSSINLPEEKTINLRKEYSNYIKEIIKKDKNKKFLLSDEVIFDKINYFGDSNISILKDVINDLKEEFEIKIRFILSIRRQPELIISNYSYTYERFYKSYGNFDNFLKNIYDDKTKEFLKIFDFYNLYKKIKDIYNCEILLLPMEELSNNSSVYINNIQNFFNSKIDPKKMKFDSVNINSLDIEGEKFYYLREKKNAGIYNFFSRIHLKLRGYQFYNENYKKIGFLRKFYDLLKSYNRKHRHDSWSKNMPTAKKISLNNVERKKILDFFSNSNKTLEEIAKKDLKQYGYYE